MNIHLIVEGQLELPVGRKLIGHCGHSAGMEDPLRGCGNIRRKAYKYAPLVMSGDGVLVLTDFMDSGCACVPQALIEYRAESVRHRAFLYRFAVPELESWLLADAAGLSNFLRIARSKIPDQPEELSDPKRTLVNLARSSKKRAVREALVPPEGSSGVVGRLYVPMLSEFVESFWNIDAAVQKAPSLARCVSRLRELQ